MQLTDNYIIDYDGPSIIKSLDFFVLDSCNDLYVLTRGWDKFVSKKISCDVIDFCCDAYIIYAVNTKNKIQSISKHNCSKGCARDGNFDKTLRNTKSANNTYKQI